MDIRIGDALVRFPRERTWLLPALHAAQERLGYLPEAALAEVAAHLRVPLSGLWVVASGYPEFHPSPRGHHAVRVCTGASCALLGSGRLLDAIAARHGVKPGETGADRELTLESADCFFECSMAPLIEVDGAYRGRVTERAVDALARWFSRSPAHGRGESAAAVGDAPAAHSTDSGPSRDVAGAAAGHPAVDAAPSRDAARATGAAAAGPGAAASATAFLDALAADAEARRQRGPALTLTVQMGTCGRSVGAEELLDAVRAQVTARRVDARVVAGACNGMCYAAPTIEIARPGWPRAVLERVDVASVPALLDQIAGDAAFRLP